MNLRLTDSAAVPYSHRVKARFLLPAISVIAATCAWSQPAPAPTPLGTVGEVNGLVTMSLGSQVATVAPGTPVFEGARFVTSSGGSLHLNLPGGCGVDLQPNQMVTISQSMTCQQQVAAIVTVTNTAAAGGAGALLRTALPLVGAAALAAAVSRDKTQEAAISIKPQ
jgi:hypothetical protein